MSLYLWVCALRLLILCAVLNLGMSWDWLNDNPLWDAYKKTKNMKHSIWLTDNMELSIEFETNFIEKNMITGNIIYHF